MKKIVISVVIIFIIMQFITIDKENPPVDLEKDFVLFNKPPADIEKMLKTSCYDCHSHETRYPWYSNVAPVSWIIKEHINNGRRHLNFSVWTDYKESKKDNKLEECIEMVRSEEMPMKGYVMLHEDAKMSGSDREVLNRWFNSLKDSSDNHNQNEN